MKARLGTSLRRLVLLSLMSLTLLGVQLLQNTALHQHTQHTVECALCHFQLSDDSEQFSLPAPALRAFSRYLPLPHLQQYSSGFPAPYQGRAPPFA